MEPDPFQQAWRAQSSRTRVTVDADLLLKTVQHGQKGLRTVKVLSDCLEIGGSLLGLSVWIYAGVATPLPWTWYLMVPVFIWNIGLTLVVRTRQRRKPNDLGGPLLKSVKDSLDLVEYQIWWSRERFWWADLPAVIAMVAFFAQITSQVTTELPANDWLDVVALAAFFVFFLGFLSVFVFAVYGFSYFLNQRVIRKTYEPQRQELLALLAGLGDETTSQVSGENPIEIAQTGSVARSVKLAQLYDRLIRAKRVEYSPRRRFVAILCAVAILLFAVSVFLIIIRFVWWAIWKIPTDT
jgi:hypothetical protein